MQVSVEQVSNLERKMTVRVPTSRYEERVRARMRELGQNVRLKGFRPGKVPASVIEKRFGAQVRNEILGDVIGSSLQEAIAKENLRPVMSPRVTREVAESPEDLVYTATFEVMPQIGEIDVAALELQRLTSSVLDEDVDRMIDTLRQQRRQWTPVERASAAGDMVMFEFSAESDAGRFPAQGAERAGTVIGARALFKEFEDLLLGLKAGESREAEIKFPIEFRDIAVAGRLAKVHISVSKVQESALPVLDASFAASFGIREGGLERFRQDVRSNLEREMKTALSNRNKLHAVDTLVHAYSSFELPTTRVAAEERALLAQTLEQARRAGREADAPKEVTAEIATVARNRVRASLLLEEIAVRNGIKANQQRVSDMLATIASTYEEPQKVIEMYLQDQQLMTGLRIRAMEEEVVEWIFERAKITAQPLGFQELMQAARA